MAASSDATDPTPADALADADFVATPSADVEVVVTDPPHTTPDGDHAFGLTVTNDGPSPATGVVLTAGPFPGATVVSVTTDKGTCTVEPDGSIACDLGDLADGDEVVITVVLSVDPGTDPADIAIEPEVAAAEPDPSPANNVESVTLPPAAPEPEPEPEPAPAPQPAPQPEPQQEVLPELVDRRPGRGPRPEPRRLVRQQARLRRQGPPAARPPARPRHDDPRRRPAEGAPARRALHRPRRPPRPSRGLAVLKIRAKTAKGRTLLGTRTYHTCTEQPFMSLPAL